MRLQDVSGSSASVSARVVAVGTGNVDNGLPSTFSKDAVPGMELWLDASDVASMAVNGDATGGQPAADGAVKYWADKSGRDNHARVHPNKTGNVPLYKAAAHNSLSALEFTNDFLAVDNSARFDELGELTSFRLQEPQYLQLDAPGQQARGKQPAGFHFRRRSGDNRRP